jgi:deoxyadenosine/deoxycytidine kinase
MTIICVEGNIAAGKSTFAARLADDLGYKLFEEPVAENPWLEKFYQDPVRYAIDLQLWMVEFRANAYKQALALRASSHCGVVMDRSLFSDVVFARNSEVLGQIDAAGMLRYYSKLEALCAGVPAPDVTLYLDTAPEMCLWRIHNVRQRQCELGIELSYLTALDSQYRRWIREDMPGVGSQVIVVPWNSFPSPQSPAYLTLFREVRKEAARSASPPSTPKPPRMSAASCELALAIE